MLVLTRKSGEGIRIGDDIKIVVVDIRDNQVKLGIEAPLAHTVHREEIYSKIKEENLGASMVSPAELKDALKDPKKRDD